MATPQTQTVKPVPANGTVKARKPREKITYGTPQLEFKARAERPVRILWKQLDNLAKIARSKSACPSEAQVAFIKDETQKRVDAVETILRARMSAKPEAKRPVQTVNLPG